MKVKNVEATGEAAAVVDAGEAEYSQHRGVQWRGTGRVVADRELEKEIERGLFGTVKSVPDAGTHERVKIALDPERTVSWDFRKIG